MSTWINLLNDIKRRVCVDMLTPTQHIAYADLCRLACHPEWINLHVAAGGGKDSRCLAGGPKHRGQISPTAIHGCRNSWSPSHPLW